MGYAGLLDLSSSIQRSGGVLGDINDSLDNITSDCRLVYSIFYIIRYVLIVVQQRARALLVTYNICGP
jgi:hypothetical protein